MTFRTSSLVVTGQFATVGGYRLLANEPVINGDSVPILVGMPVTIVGSGTVKRSSAANTGLATVDGIVWSGNDPTLNMMMRAAGQLELSDAEWEAVTGISGGLIPGAIYYLGLTPGTITTSPPWHDGQSVTVIGKAFTEGSLFVELGSPILL